MNKNIAEQWIEDLKSKHHYCHKIENRLKFIKFKFRPLSRHLKLIINMGKIQPGMKILDFGAGGGHDSVPLAYLGCHVDALDCSNALLNNLINYKESLEKYSKRILRINLIEADILNSNLLPNNYDIIFSCGVMEHFLDDDERKLVYKILSKSLKKSGCIITSVPNGNHPLRARQKSERLGGYNIEEIDYTLNIFKKDIFETDLVFEKAKGFNLFGYIFILPIFAKYRVLQIIIKPFYLFFRLLENWIPFYLMRKYAFCLLFGARKKKNLYQ